MDVRHLKPFIESVRHLFTTMLNTEIIFNRPFLPDKDSSSSGISAIIGFSGDASGIMALCFSKKVADKIAAKFQSADKSEGDVDVADAVGELANMVAGQAKAKMEGLNIYISLPRVVASKNLQVLRSRRIPVVVLPCDCQLGRFMVEVSMMTKTPPKATDKLATARANA